ncbi:MAG: polysaccharide biosynthesis tyrosine autokinase [Verrucomicrobiota bacterium]
MQQIPPAGGAPPQGSASESLFPGFPALDIAKIIKSIIKRSWIVALCGFGFAALAIAYVLTAEKTYEASATLYAESSANSNSLLKDFRGSGGGYFNSLDALKSMAAGITSGTNTLRVVETLKLTEDPTYFKKLRKSGEPLTAANIVKAMSKKVDSRLVRGERNIIVTARDSDPERTKLLVETYVDEFRSLLREQNAQKGDKNRALLQSKRDGQELKVKEAENALQAFREQHPDLPLDDSNHLAEGQLADLERKLNSARAELSRVESEFEQLQSIDPDNPEPILEIGKYAVQDHIQKLLLARDQKSSEFFNIKSQYQPRHPKYVETANELEGLNTKVSEAALKVGETIEKTYRTTVKSVSDLQSEISDQKSKMLLLGSTLSEFRTLKRNVDASYGTYNKLLDRINEAEVTESIDETVIRVFSPPLVPSKPVAPQKALTVALAGIFGGCVGLGLVLLISLLDRTMASRQQVESTLNIPVLAAIPKSKNTPSAMRQTLANASARDPRVTESFRSLRTALSSFTPRSVMVASSSPEDGKTFCAAQLAAMQAQLGYRTLLIDTDFSNPQMGDLFGFTSSAEQSGSTELATQNFCRETPIPNLYLVTCDKCRAENGEPMTGEHFAAMLWEAYASFDCVIIDSASTSCTSDGLNYSRFVDAVALVVRAGKTQTGKCQNAIKELRRMRAPIVGTILNDAKASEASQAPAGTHHTTATPQLIGNPMPRGQNTPA